MKSDLHQSCQQGKCSILKDDYKSFDSICELELMGLYRVPEYKNIKPEFERPSLKSRNRLISIVSIILFFIGMTLLIRSS